jgi:hemolysin III
LAVKTSQEEWANGLTHAVGWLLSVVGGVLLVREVWSRGTNWHVLGCVVFGISLVSVYGASTLSHWVQLPQWKRRFRIWDQGLIYLLIAGTYTPLAVAFLVGWWHLLTVTMWGCAVAGFVSKIGFNQRIEGIAVWLYLGLGWMPILAVPHILTSAPGAAFSLVLAGGVSYTLGAAFLMNDHRAPYLHAVWHLFVMAGSACHYWAVWRYALPAA